MPAPPGKAASAKLEGSGEECRIAELAKNLLVFVSDAARRAPGAGSRNSPRPQSPPRRQSKTVRGGASSINWFFIALCTPFLLACANHNDKFLLSRYLKEKNIGSIAIFSSLFSGVAIAIVLFIQPDVYDVSLVQGSALVATGMSSVLASVCYLYALE